MRIEDQSLYGQRKILESEQKVPFSLEKFDKMCKDRYKVSFAAGAETESDEEEDEKEQDINVMNQNLNSQYVNIVGNGKKGNKDGSGYDRRLISLSEAFENAFKEDIVTFKELQERK